MTTKEIIQELQKLPPDTEVFIFAEHASTIQKISCFDPNAQLNRVIIAGEDI